ncbi:MAG: hypothetical protein QM654_08650 [Dysgonamonadaceae bacterium]
MKKKTLLTVSFALLLGISSSAFAQQPHNPQNGRPEVTQQDKKNSDVGSKRSYTTQTYQYTKSKMSKAALRKKLLGMDGVKNVAIDGRARTIRIVFDAQRAPQEHLRKHLNDWGIPGQFGGDRKQPQQGEGRR